MRSSIADAAQPYVSKYNGCKILNNADDLQNIKLNYQRLENNTDAIKEGLVSFGVLSIAVHAETWSYYKRGIFDFSKQNHKLGSLGHAANIVGYGSENGNEYLVLKNSWGTNWGENGYIRVATSPSENTLNYNTTLAVTECELQNLPDDCEYLEETLFK